MLKPDPEITEFLHRWEHGDPGALQQIMPLVYAQLRSIAENQLGRESAGHTLQATALVNELYLRLTEQHDNGKTGRISLPSRP
jgi:RNA polymerase sigma-70 factor (ECF subfamily)